MAFIPCNFTSNIRAHPLRTHHRSVRMCEQQKPTPADDNSTPGRKLPVSNSPASSGKKLVRNKTQQYADARPGDMVGGPKVGEGMGPRRGTKEKKVTRAAEIQKSQSFADAWAEQNQGRVDVWLIIGAMTLLTPIVIIAWAVATGVIPTGGLFE